ncbi:MAG: hypothetical protein Kow0098_18360 [Ignavibacteriaceae bacterium]
MKKLNFILILSGIMVFSSCSVYETFVNVSRLQFRLGLVENFMVNGINITGKKSIKDFTASEIIRISSSVIQGSLPVSFTLNVEAKNPNDGTGGYKRTDASIQSFPWRLLLDDKEILTGNLDSPVAVPGTGEVTVIPISISVDLVKLFREQGYESLLNLALAIGGSDGSSSRLTLYARPGVSTDLGNISYPGELKIIDKSFTN